MPRRQSSRLAANGFREGAVMASKGMRTSKGNAAE